MDEEKLVEKVTKRLEYNKKFYLKHERYIKDRMLLHVLLSDKLYTFEEVDKIIEKFKNRKVVK